MQAIDMTSPEFQAEWEKTIQFIEETNLQFGLVQNPNEEINEGISMGLARNQLMYTKRYCPCFMVMGKTQEERDAADNRVCPCKPALQEEIPQNGHCHCGLFCTPEYADMQRSIDKIEETVHQHSKGLIQEEAQLLLKQEQIDGDELEALLEARELGMIRFDLIDVREYMEFKMGHIVGTDLLVPTSQFYDKIQEVASKKKNPIIVYCHTGSRSFQVQHAMKSLGFEHVCNLKYGIVSYSGETQRG